MSAGSRFLFRSFGALAALGGAFVPSIIQAQQIQLVQLPALTATPLGSSVQRLTLEEARQLALNNNKARALSRLNLQEKQFGPTAAKKDYFPKVLGNVTYLHFNENLGDVVTLQSRRPLGILAPGTRTIDVSVLNQDSTFSSLMVVQPITKLIGVNALVQLARADENIAQAKLDKGVQDVLAGVNQLYYGLGGARRIEAALTLQIRMVEQLGGVNPPAALRIGLVEAQQGLVQVRGQVKDLSNQLTDLLDLPSGTHLELEDPLPPNPRVHDEEEAAKLALCNNAEVREAEQGLAKARAALQVAKMDYYPDVFVFGAYTNQTAANYIQDNIGTVGVMGSYTFWDWGKRRDVKHQRQALIAVAQQNVQVTADKVQLEARKSYSAFEQARDALKLSGDMVQARKDSEKNATDQAAVMAAKGLTAKAELEYMKAEIAYRVAHAQLMGLIGQ